MGFHSGFKGLIDWPT